MSAHPSHLALELPCVHRAVRVGRRVVQTFARTDEVPDEEIERLMLVTSELLANAVDHGGGGGAFTEADLESEVVMFLRLEIDAKGWHLEVEDQGGGDPTESAATLAGDKPIDPEDERGRGLFLVREMVGHMAVRAGERGLIFEAHREVQRGE
ncbi:MAG: ATP-binding protein [Planctomycetota bacterium]|nr:ATP-binding protein [Planctomycetota bacterium]